MLIYVCGFLGIISLCGVNLGNWLAILCIALMATKFVCDVMGW